MMSENDNDSSSSLTLNKLEEFHRKQKQLEWERRKKRNEEVDDLISKLGDPKVAEKLRIYRLVEDQFTHIEKEVERQVKAELAAKKRNVQSQNPEPAGPKKEAKVGNILAKAKKFRQELASELQSENPPEPIKDNLAKVRAERQALAKEKLLGKRMKPQQHQRPGPVLKSMTKPIRTIPSIAATKKVKNEETDGIIMLSKPIIRDLSEAEKQELLAAKPNKNVGYAEYFHSADEVDTTKILSAHVLSGVNISPQLTVTKTSSLRSKIIEELHQSLSESNSSSIENEVQKSPVFIPEPETKDVEETKEPEKQEDHEDGEYSDCFEDDNDEDSDEYVKNVLVPKIIETQGNFTEEDSGRLSTIPEVPSQATSVEEFNKMLEEGPITSGSDTSTSSSSESVENQSVIKETQKSQLADESLQSPQPEAEPQKVDIQRPIITHELSLSEGPILVSEDSSIVQPNLSLSEGPLSPESEEKENKILVDQAVNTSEKAASPAKSSSLTSSSSSSRQTSQSLSSSWHESSGISEGQLVLKNSLSEGEILSGGEEGKRKTDTNSSSPHDSLEQ